MPRYKHLFLTVSLFCIAAAALTTSMGCSNKAEDPKPPSGSGYYTGDDFHGKSGTTKPQATKSDTPAPAPGGTTQ